MTKTLLAWLGALLLLALVGTAVGGLMLVKDRVRVVIEDDATPDEGARQVAQLRDELGQVQRDVQALANHAIMHTQTALELYGRVLCGLPPNTPIY